VAAPARRVPSGGSGRSHHAPDRAVWFLGAACCSAPCWSTVIYVTDSRKRAVHLLWKPNRSVHMLGYGLHLFRKDAVPHSMLVVAIILAVVLLIL
jgi:hypothetical protein